MQRYSTSESGNTSDDRPVMKAKETMMGKANFFLVSLRLPVKLRERGPVRDDDRTRLTGRREVQCSITSAMLIGNDHRKKKKKKATKI